MMNDVNENNVLDDKKPIWWLYSIPTNNERRCEKREDNAKSSRGSSPSLSEVFDVNEWHLILFPINFVIHSFIFLICRVLLTSSYGKLSYWPIIFNRWKKHWGEATTKNKKQYDLISLIVDKYVVPTAHNIDISKGSDYVKNYGTSFIFLITMLLQMKDTAKEADGGRNLLLNLFRTEDTQSKYAKEMFVAISQYEC